MLIDSEAAGRPGPGSRPPSITVVGLVFVAVGCASLAAGAGRFASDIAATAPNSLLDLCLVAGSALLAAVGGVFVLRGRAWARWLCAAWLGFHVALSLVHSRAELAVHGVLFVAISLVLFRPAAGAYFRRDGAAS